LNKTRDRILIVTYAWATVFAGGLLFLMTLLWDSASGIVNPQTNAEERIGLSVIIILGALGGFIRWMDSLRNIQSSTEKQSSDWTLWLFQSLIMPLKGATLAVPFTLLLRAGIAGLPEGNDGSGVNWIGLYAVAGLSGLFAPEAIEKLENAFRSLFGLESPKKE
jgi:hypothetical protein